MQVHCLSNGHSLTLDTTTTLGAGGEARIYPLVQNSSLVAKVYRRPNPVQARKLAVMMTHPPEDPMVVHGHTSIAWPVALLSTRESRRQVIGFLMPRVTGMRPLMVCYNPALRRQQWPLFTYRYLLRTAHNLAAAVRTLHARGYVIGDVNESNVLVTDTALVTLVDTDSFQVREPQSGVVYRCPVGKPEYTPPELQGCPFPQVDRVPAHDLFGLAVLIFQLLMEGTHPYAGVYQGRGDPPGYAARIAAGHFPYSRGQQVPYRPMPSAPPYALLPPTIQGLFVRCFERGHTQPQARPDAHAWQRALHEAEQSLIVCAANEQHLYSRHLHTCPWCRRGQGLGGRDPFPARQAVRQRHQHHPPVALPSPLRTSGSPTAVSFPRPAPPWRLRSVLRGAFWGTVAAVLVHLLVSVILHRPLMPETLLMILGEAWQKAGGSAMWGALWGALWEIGRRSWLSGSPAWSRSTGALLGAMMGMLTSTLLGMTPGSTTSISPSAWLAMLHSVPWHAPLPLLREMLRAFVASMYLHALPGASVGIALGLVWGMWRR